MKCRKRWAPSQMFLVTLLPFVFPSFIYNPKQQDGSESGGRFGTSVILLRDSSIITVASHLVLSASKWVPFLLFKVETKAAFIHTLECNMV